MAGNASLTRFRNQTTFWAITAVVAFVIGGFLLGTSSREVVLDYTDGYSTYDTYDDCLYSNDMDETTDDLITCSDGKTESVVNAGAVSGGYFLLGVGGLAFNFAIIGRFLILTTDSLLEGLGGNLGKTK